MPYKLYVITGIIILKILYNDIKIQMYKKSIKIRLLYSLHLSPRYIQFRVLEEIFQLNINSIVFKKKLITKKFFFYFEICIFCILGSFH